MPYTHGAVPLAGRIMSYTRTHVSLPEHIHVHTFPYQDIIVPYTRAHVPLPGHYNVIYTYTRFLTRA